MQRRRVVVTGLGIISPVGNTVPEAWDNVLAGRSGIARVTRFDPSRLSSQIAGEVKDFDVAKYLPPKEARRMDRFIHFGMAAGLQAWQDSGNAITPETAERFGIIFGSGIGGLPLIEEMHDELTKNGPRRVSPFFIPGTIINMIAGNLSIMLGAKGPNLAIVTACTTSTHCIGEAGKSIRHGETDVMIAGGAEATVTELAMGGFASARALSTRNDDPAGASRPWDKDRDGFVLGEGAGAVVLEEYEHAKKRGARIYCELAGYGVSADAFHMTAPAADGGERAKKVAVNSTKSMTGHLLGAAGGVEAVFSILALQNQVSPPTINQQSPDPQCDLDYVPNAARKMTIRTALSNSFGFGGTNGSLVFRRP